MPVRRCEACGRSFTQSQGRPARFCPEHRRGGGRYGGDHKKLRAATKDQAYGQPCCRCGRPMLPGQELHLDHADGGGPADYLGWSHAACNERAGQLNGARMRAPGGPAAAQARPPVIPPAYEPGSIRHSPDCKCGGRVTWQPGEWWTSRCW